jgi:ABC-type glycerol-3-phosphate transport system permease component
VLQFGNYAAAWHSAPFGRFFLNSAVVAVSTVLANLVLCSLAGYAFARYRFLGRAALFALLMATLAALTFLDSWNNFLWPLIAVTSTSQLTVPLGLATFQGAHQTQIPQLMAGNVRACCRCW